MKSLKNTHLTFCASVLALIASTGMVTAQDLELISSPGIPKVEISLVSQAQPTGSLSDASVFVSSGHGWMWRKGKWHTQRGNSHGVVEDHSNGEIGMQYLTKYLWNSGARVNTTRERCMNPNEVIVEVGGEGWIGTGDWDQESSTGMYHGRQFRTETTPGMPTATANFVPEIPADGYYGVYIWYRPTLDGDMISDARITINHTGGETLWLQDLNHDGYTWKYIGEYYFEKGTNPETGSVYIDNQSSEGEKYLTVSAVRFGGGMGSVVRNGAPSGKPRWEESGRYYTEFMGFKEEQDTRLFGTVGAMPMWSEWECEEWEKGKSIYISHHTNASGKGTARGMSSFIYGPNGWNRPSENVFTGYPLGKELTHIAHNQIINQVHKTYDPDWRDIGVVSRWLGETNPRNNNKMPCALFEYGFHDNKEDAAYILDPVFRDLCAKATARGVIKFFKEYVDGFDSDTFLPEKPTHLQVTKSGATIAIKWNEPPFDKNDEDLLGDKATSYRVYTSKNGKGFDNGQMVRATTLRIPTISLDSSLFIRVTAINEGGESFPTETLAIYPTTGKSNVLVVNGFDRLDRELNLKDEKGVERGFLQKMNSFDYSIQHGKALETSGIAYDSTSNDAVTSGTVHLSNYKAVVWILGQEKGESVLDNEEQKAIEAFLKEGGNLFISGSELASSLTGTDQSAFLNEVLQAELKTDFPMISGEWNSVVIDSCRLPAGTDLDMSKKPDYTFTATEDSIFKGLESAEFGLGLDANSYPVQQPDSLQPVGDTTVALKYGANNEPAAIQHEGAYRLVYLGFPFETISSEKTRSRIMKQSMEFLLK
jgi:N-acetylmuramoyl-L-alanine amidase